LIAVKIPGTRKFLADLLSRNTFDSFVLGEATLTTFTSFHIDGTWHPDYFQDDRRKIAGSAESAESVSRNPAAGPVRSSSSVPEKETEPSWQRLRPYVSGLVKGSHSPVSFRIVLKMAPKGIEGVLKNSGSSFTPDQVDGLFMNISYQDGKITCTSGTSMKTFTMDKSLDHAWDQMMLKFFDAKAIPYEQL